MPWAKSDLRRHVAKIDKFMLIAFCAIFVGFCSGFAAGFFSFLLLILPPEDISNFVLC